MKREGCGQVILGALFVLVACLVFAALAGALVRTGEVPLYGPRLSGFQPDPSDPVLPTTPFTFTFDQAMDTESVESALSLTSAEDGRAVPGTIHWNKARTEVTFIPKEQGFAPGASYTIQMRAGAKAGTLPRTTTRGIEWTASLPPLLEMSTPLPGETDSDAWPVLQADFNYTLDCKSTTQAFSISPAAPGELVCEDQTLVFSPTRPLEPGTAYVANLESVFLAGDDWARPGVRWELETAPPLAIVAASPADGASLVDLLTTFNITFNRPVVAESVQERFALTSDDGERISGQMTWEQDGATMVFQPDVPLAPVSSYYLELQAGVRDNLGFKSVDSLARSYETEAMLGPVTPTDGRTRVHLTQEIHVEFTRPMDQDSVEAGLTFVPAINGDATWEENTLILFPLGGLAPETEYQAAISADVQDASGAPLGESFGWSFSTQPLLLGARPPSGAVLTEMQMPIQYTFALPMDRSSVQAALEISPQADGDLVWSNEDRAVAFHPGPGWLSGTDYEVTLSGTASTAGGYHTLGDDHTVAFATAPSHVQFGEGPNAQVMDAGGNRAFQFVFQGSDMVEFTLYPITPTQFLDLYSSGFRGIGPSEGQLMDTAGLTPTVTWRETPIIYDNQRQGDWIVAEAYIPSDVPVGLYLLTTPSVDTEAQEWIQRGLLVVLTEHGLVLKRALSGSGSRSQAQIVAWDTEIDGGAPVISSTVRLYDRDGSFLTEGQTGAGGLLNMDVPGDPGPLLALSEQDDDVTICGLSNEWSEGGWWWWWTQPPSQPLYTIYSYTDRPIYRPAQTIYFKDIVRADDDVSYTLPGPDLPVTVRLRDARDNVAATQVISPNLYGTVHGEFQLADEPMLGTWNLETEVEGTVTRQPLKVEEYRKPEYEVTVRSDSNTYVHGEIISLTVDAAYYFGQPVTGADVELLVYPTYPETFAGENGPQFGYPIFSEDGQTDEAGQWVIQVPTEDVFHEGGRSRLARLALEATVTDDSGQSVSSYQSVVVQRASKGLTMLQERYGYRPNETITFSILANERDGAPASGLELTAQVLGWDGSEAATGQATTGETGEAFFSVRLSEQGWYEILVSGTDEEGRDMRTASSLWVYDPTGAAPWYQGQWSEDMGLSISADRSAYAVGDEAQLIIYAPTPGLALLSFERGQTRHAEPITLISGTNLITVPIRDDFAPNIYVTVNQFGPLGEQWWEIQSRPEAQLHTASTELTVPMADRALTVTLTADQETYGPGDEATFSVLVVDHSGQPVEAEVSLAVVDESIYALAEDMSKDPFKVFYSPRTNLVRTSNSLNPVRWLFPEGPGLGGGMDEEGDAPRRNFLDTAYWAPTITTGEGGTATITLQLPDNLTEWRALARAVTTDTLVGQTTTHVVVSQDIVVRPVLPRFLVQGDSMTLTVIVHNFTGRRASAAVNLDMVGLSLLETEMGSTPSKQVIDLPANGSATVSWLVRAETPAPEGQAEAQVLVEATASFGARLIGKDAIELTVPVHPLAVPEIATFAGTLTPEEPTDTITITLPSDAIEGLSRLEINLAPSVAPGLLNGLVYLIDYPFG